MLIIVSKCISTFSSQIILNDVHYHKYHQQHHWQISCKSVTVDTSQYDLSFGFSDLSFAIWVEADIPVCKIVLHALGPGCSMALLWSFHPDVVSLLSPEKLFDNHPLGEAPATWRNKYNWFKWVMSSDTKKIIVLESHLLEQIAVTLKFSAFSSIML